MNRQIRSAQAAYIASQTAPGPPAPKELAPNEEPKARTKQQAHQAERAANRQHDLQLAHQVLHNLRHQHDWTHLSVHTHGPVHFADPGAGPGRPFVFLEAQAALPKPLVIGTPPKPVYVHPDAQLALIKANVREQDCRAEQTVVLPTRLAERVTLRSLAQVFDMLPPVQGLKLPASARANAANAAAGSATTDGSDESDAGPTGFVHGASSGPTLENGKAKRLLLATVNDDSTITYYVMHDGVVKPRQN